MAIPEEISISVAEYRSLIKDQLMLEALEMYGVDNWEGYSEAQNHVRSTIQAIHRDAPNHYEE